MKYYLGLLLCIGLLAGCTQSSQSNASGSTVPTSNEGAPALNEVVISNFRFSPSSIIVGAGQPVTWINQDSVGHTIVSDTGLFSSPLLNSGERYSFTFNTAGNYSYHCSVHPSMTGVVLVD